MAVMTETKKKRRSMKRRPNGKGHRVRHTFHLEDNLLESLRDAVTYVQKHPGDFDQTTHGNLSRLIAFAAQQELSSMETKIGRRIPKRFADEGVLIGRPPADLEEFVSR